MKKILLALVIATFVFLQCGEDGRDGMDGLAFLAFDWDTLPDWYYDNNDGIPAEIHWMVDYQIEPGSYEFSYGITEGSIYYEWQGTYRVTINEGQRGRKGGLFSDGADGRDGEDIYYTIFLGAAAGPDLTWFRPSVADPHGPALAKSLPASRLEKLPVGALTVKELSNGYSTLRLEYRLIGQTVR